MKHTIKTLEDLGPMRDGAVLLTCTCGDEFVAESWEPSETFPPQSFTKAQQVAMVMKQHQEHINGLLS